MHQVSNILIDIHRDNNQKMRLLSFQYSLVTFKLFSRLIPRSGQSDYVSIIKDGNECYSWIGKQGGQQELSIGEGCQSKGTVIHEIMHLIGMISRIN